MECKKRDGLKVFKVKGWKRDVTMQGRATGWGCERKEKAGKVADDVIH